jgi:hypothetical protein
MAAGVPVPETAAYSGHSVGRNVCRLFRLRPLLT